MSSPLNTVKTKILIVSDTHGRPFPPDLAPRIRADVAIHCGDITEESKLEEYKASMKVLHDIDAPLKLVIAGNHDFTLDPPAFQKILQSSGLLSDADEGVVHREYGRFGEAESLFTTADGITFLQEGTHQFVLSNGAKLTVYASPFTPSNTPDWGFQYFSQPVGSISASDHFNDGHTWAISDAADIAITHSPPYGVLDRSQGAVRRGSRGLFAAIEKARPRLHCFGHVHQGWGAKSVAWRDPGAITAISATEDPAADQQQLVPASHLTHIDNGRSKPLESLATLNPGRFDSGEEAKAKEDRLQGYRKVRYCEAHCAELKGQETLFVNAAIQGHGDGPESFQLPWLVNIDLERAMHRRQADS
ncbi:calcineurin-like phosphoesterase domain-containing protein [Sarocladium implicatum]|nr:calcineurin-like phosphoesterase domain-containing protein [Sarocladium implicatum]